MPSSLGSPHLSFVFVLSFASLGSLARAQRVHPNVADASPALITNSTQNTLLTQAVDHPAESPLFNRGDGLWDQGELALGPGFDEGGIRNVPLATSIVPVLAPQPNANVFKVTSTTAPDGWKKVTEPIGAQSITLWRFRGRFGKGTLLAQVEEAGFEVICAENYVPGLLDIIVVTTPSTTGTGDLGNGWTNGIGPRFAYPGFPDGEGIGQWGQPDRLLLYFHELQGAGKRCNVIIAQANARVLGRPGGMQVQRNLELVRTVREMFRTTDATWRPPAPPSNWDAMCILPGYEIPALIAGGSFGGAVAYWMALMYPEDFQAALSTGGPPSPRRAMSEQESGRQLMALSGFGNYTVVLDTCDFVHCYSMMAQMAASRGLPVGSFDGFFQGNVLTAMRSGFLKRPMLFTLNDEDSVSTGVDWGPVLSGQREWTDSGVRTIPANGSVPAITIHWAAVGKRCHGDAPYPYKSPFDGHTFTGYWQQLAVEFLNYLEQNQQMMQPAAFTPPTAVVNATEDSYEHAFMPGPLPAPATSPLHRDQAFAGNTGPSPLSSLPEAARLPGKSFGSGLYLGYADSLVTGQGYQAEAGSLDEIFVGSAEGVVTRFAVDPTTEEMVPQAMSEPLGFGAWGLALGEADGAPGKEVIVATHRGLFTLYRDSLQIINENRNLPWNQYRPLRLAVCNPLGGSRAQVIMACEGGQLALYNLDNISLAAETYFEPGIVDLAVLNPADNSTSPGNPVQLLVLSQRGHVVRLEWDLQASPRTLTLMASSPRLNGVPRDMELMPNGKVAVLMDQVAASHKESIWVLDTASLGTTLQQFTFAGGDTTLQHGNPSGGSGRDLEVVDIGGTTYFITLKGDRIALIDGANGSGAVSGTFIELSSFQPLLRPLDLKVANVAGDEKSELLVSTEAGYVCWLPLAELVSPGTALPFAGTNLLPFDTLIRQPGVANAPPRRCNRTLSGTWGMVQDGNHLELLDQSGTRWRADRDGNVTLVQEIGGSSPLGFLPLAGPFRGMGKLVPTPTGNSSVTVTSPTPIQSPDPFPGLQISTTRELETSPLLPGVGTFNFGGPGTWRVPGGPLDRTHATLANGFAAFPRSGHAIATTGGGLEVAWWSGEEHSAPSRFGNFVQGLRITAAGQIQDWWSTAAPAPGAPTGPGSVLADAQVLRQDLRAYHGDTYAARHMQALRLFEDPAAGNAVRCAVLTPGARLMILERPLTAGSVGAPMVETDNAAANPKVLDFGTGGAALAVHRRGDDIDLYVGSVAFFTADASFNAAQTAQTPADDMISAIAAVSWQGNGSFTAGRLGRRNQLLLDGAGGRPKVYGVCGMAVGDVIPANGAVELIVGSLDGHLLVFELDATTGAIGNLLYQDRVGGSMGAYNAIIAADLDGNGVDEVYAAGSLGLRKWRN